MEKFMPLGEIKSKFEPHVSWQGHMIVKIVTGENTSHMSVGAHSDGPNHVAALNEVSRWQELALSEDLIKI